MFEQLNFRVNFNNADYSDLHFSEAEKTALRELAKQVAEIAARPVMQDRKNLWIRHNKLEVTRPLLLCDPENGWNEIITEESIVSRNSIARHWEDHLRKQIFWGNEMMDDYVVEPYFNLPYVFKETQWTVAGSNRVQTIKKTAEQGKSYHIETVLENYDQIKDIIKSKYLIDYDTTEKLLSMAHEIFDGILEVRLNTVWFWSFGMTDDYVFLRGMEKLMYDFIDEPENVHKLMELLYRGTVEKLEFLENSGLNNDGTFVGSGGIGFTDELPAKNFTGHVRMKDMWGLGESQVTVGISPDMFEEFIFPYQKKIMERFGLTCYGCCEPMDKRFDIVKSVPNLRRVSVSPWANKEIMAEKLGKNYVFSYKPSPSYLAVPELDEEEAREHIREVLDVTKNNHTEFIMKDNHTLCHNPDNIKNWVRIFREESER